eukprot:gnl/Chilomastix_cuspidata/1198.p4 GENE.gnl/Chilomastix_cuspidata/1198~~gnl/Chilomastix_cuspidata/1198.p4  ORF type:complete len:302 (-),score=142.99 gnl/Chilomastix_cuspidata/1198:444-1349(-)
MSEIHSIDRELLSERKEEGVDDMGVPQQDALQPISTNAPCASDQHFMASNASFTPIPQPPNSIEDHLKDSPISALPVPLMKGYVPQLNQEFSSLASFEEQLHAYAKNMGFRFSVKSSSRSPDRVVTSKLYICSRGGHYRRHVTHGSRPNTHTIKCGCPVAVGIGWRSSRRVYVVNRVELAHNHALDGRVKKIPTRDLSVPEKVISKRALRRMAPRQEESPSKRHAESLVRKIALIAEQAPDDERGEIADILKSAAMNLSLQLLHPDASYDAVSATPTLRSVCINDLTDQLNAPRLPEPPLE